MATLPPQAVFAVGEPGKGVSGFRLAHHQAAAALTVALCKRQRFIRYADVAITAALHRDEVLTASLHQLYIEPLESFRDGGKTARGTLRAYFSVGGNASSASEILGVRRRTVTYRLKGIESALGRPLFLIATDLELALRLYDLSAIPPTDD